MLDYQRVKKAAAILRKHLELSPVDSEKAAATLDEYDLARLVDIDDDSEAAALYDRPAARAAAKSKIQAMVDSKRNTPAA